MKHTIRPDGRNHSMPKGMYKFFSELESLAEVEAVNSGRFIPRNKVNGFEANIQFYDESSRTFRVRVGYKGFISYFNIRVSPDTRDRVEDYIRNYRADGFRVPNLQVALPEACYGLNSTSMVGV